MRKTERERKGSVYFFGGGAATALDTPTEKLLKVYLEIKIFEPARLTRRLAALAIQAAIIEIAFWTNQITLKQSKTCSQLIKNILFNANIKILLKLNDGQLVQAIEVKWWQLSNIDTFKPILCYSLPTLPTRHVSSCN